MQGQTIGVPVGPDTSLLAAEIVLAEVDRLLLSEIGPVKGFRYIDDYELYFSTAGAAETGLSILEGCLADFELTINPRKTSIVGVPDPLQESWVSDLLRFPVRSGSATQTLNDSIAFFSHAFELARRNPTDGVLKYAVLRARSFPIQARGWRTFEGLVLAAVSADPTTLPAAFDLLDEHSRKLGAQISRKAVFETLEPLIVRHATLRNGSEVAWALWTALAFDIRLSREVGRAVSQMEDDFVALLALDAEQRGRLPAGSLDKTSWVALASSAQALTEEHWLMTYEGQHQGWLHEGQPAVAADPFFSVLDQAGVSFYVMHPPRAPFTGPAGPLPGGTIPESYL
jgi:hypothetical protein